MKRIPDCKREIKFRAWHKYDLSLKPSFWFMDWDELMSMTMEKVFGNLDDNHPFILEQFTGLFDKNGKEVYEGDILKDEYDSIGVVRWSKSFWEFSFVQGNVTSNYSGMNDGDDVEIIGNIHENQELVGN